MKCVCILNFYDYPEKENIIYKNNIIYHYQLSDKTISYFPEITQECKLVYYNDLEYIWFTKNEFADNFIDLKEYRKQKIEKINNSI